jgi:aryl-alcohol dehydrogenase-like predicted oxidoreductase
MITTHLGSTDVEIGRLAFGCSRFAEAAESSPHERIETALNLGMNLIDTADIYGFTSPVAGSDSDGFGGAEVMLGRVIKEVPHLRDKMILATKGGIRPPIPYNSSQSYLMDALDASLRRLRTDYVDLYQIHRPDLLTSFEELGRVLGYMVESGKVRHIGVSNFTNSQLRALEKFVTVPLVSRQPQGSLWHHAPIMDGTLDMCQEYKLTPLIWSPLAGGQLATGQVDNAEDRLRFNTVISVIDELAETHSATRTQIALAFLLKHPSQPVPLVGSQKPRRLEEAAGALKINLSSREWYGLLESRLGSRMP